MSDPILQVSPLSNRWQTLDPFLFCVHHIDLYPKGNDRFGPAASLAGHDIGQDFGNPDGWSMYHGDVVPGFPQHPHRGIRDRSPSSARATSIIGFAGRGGAVRHGRRAWLTAGAGVVHRRCSRCSIATDPTHWSVSDLVELPAKHKLATPLFHEFWRPGHPASVGIPASRWT